MSNDIRPTLHPALWVAAASITAFSLAGLGAVTGLIPFGPKGAEPAAQVAAVAAPAPAASAPAQVAPAPAHVAPTPVTAPTARANPPRPVRTARHEPADIEVIRSEPRETGYQIRTTAPVAAPAAPPPVCYDCGVIESVRDVEMPGEGSGLGAIAGGVLGGAVGNQVGRGHGNTLATIAGVVGGAYAGHQIEKAQKKSVQRQVTVRFDDGTTRVIPQDGGSAWRPGDRVRVVNGVIAAAS